SKATTKYGGRKYLAWFTPEIPVMDGPYVFAGLPGLIVRIKDDQDFYIFEATEIQVGRQSIFYDPEIINKYSQKLDRKTFVEDIIKFKNSPYVLGRLNSTAEEKLALKKRYLSRMDLLIEKY
ncbi:MAG: GLPGLI family protein, partial [Saprospiraceae bacterium]